MPAIQRGRLLRTISEDNWSSPDVWNSFVQPELRNITRGQVLPRGANRASNYVQITQFDEMALYLSQLEVTESIGGTGTIRNFNFETNIFGRPWFGGVGRSELFVNDGFSEETFGKVKCLPRAPKNIHIIYGLGWFGAHGQYLEIGPDTPLSQDYDWYLQPGGGVGTVGQMEPLASGGINYFEDLYSELEPYCRANGIGIIETLNGGRTGDLIDPEHDIATDFIDPGPENGHRAYNHPGRWLLGIIGLQVPRGFSIGEDYDALENGILEWMYGGDLFTIAFVTDGLQIYHGYSNDHGTLADPGSTYWGADMNRLDQFSQIFRNFGGVVISNPKNPEFFPTNFYSLRTQSRGGGGGGFDNDGRAFCYQEASAHLLSASSDIALYGFDYLSRSFSVGSPGVGTPHEGVHGNHMEWNGPSPTVAEIVTLVQNFFE